MTLKNNSNVSNATQNFSIKFKESLVQYSSNDFFTEI